MSSPSPRVSNVDSKAVDTCLMTLRKPTELKKVIDSVPKPVRAVPKFGLPQWYRLGLECKLPVPKMPAGKITFSRGKMGEDIRRVGLGNTGPQQTFDLTDPYCHNVSYDYAAVHDPHLAHHFAQKATRDRMKELGFCTPDGRAVCSLKEFNQYRKYLYNQFMDRIHQTMDLLDVRARDNLTLKRVNVDVAKRLQIFNRSERVREQLLRASKEHADEIAEKKRLAKEQEKKIQMRMNYLQEYNERMRKERAEKGRERQNRIKQRVKAAEEIELRRKITMVRQWRLNEKKRLNRLKQDKEQKTKRLEDEANRKWALRVATQNQKITEETNLLKMYTDDMKAGTMRRIRKADIYAYNQEMELARIRLANWKLGHGGRVKDQQIIKRMGIELERSKRGTKGMSPAYAQVLAQETVSTAFSTRGDPFMTLGQARIRMEVETTLPSAPVKLLEEVLETSVMEFARRRTNLLMRDVERVVRARAAQVFFQNIRPEPKKRPSNEPRWTGDKLADFGETLPNSQRRGRSSEIMFGEAHEIPTDETTDIDLKSCKTRIPTPVPSKTLLVEVTFGDRCDDLPDPIAMGYDLPERRKMLEMVNAAARLLSRSVTHRVLQGLDVIVGTVTLPSMRQPMEWGEAVEGLAGAVAGNRVSNDNADVRRTSLFLAHRILRSLLAEMKEEKKKIKENQLKAEADEKDFYTPLTVKEKTSTPAVE